MHAGDVLPGHKTDDFFIRFQGQGNLRECAITSCYGDKDVRRPDYESVSPFIKACRYGDLDIGISRFLIETGKDAYSDAGRF